MLRESDKIFGNLHGADQSNICSAKARGDWDNVSGILNASSDVRITGNINAGISTLTGKATVGSVTLQHSDIVAGVVTATSYKGDGADLTGLPAGFSWIEGNLF